MLYSATLIELLHIAIGFNQYVTRQFKICYRGEKGLFPTSTQILESIYVSWQNNYGMSKVHVQATV